MVAKIIAMEIKDFRGIKEQRIDFVSDKTIISGRNASGKSTIASAFFWVLFDKDITLASNPNVKPLGVAECSPTVSLTLDVDSKTIEISKTQTITTKTSEDGVVKSSSKNTYLWNKVPVTERDFKAKLDEMGFPSSEVMLMASHTDVFTSMKQADARKILMNMASEKTDLEIANEMGNVNEVLNLLGNYTLEEIVAMNKASIKKCNEQVESIPDIIIGLEQSKVNVDVKAFNSKKNDIETEITNLDKAIKELEEKKNQQAEIRVKSLQLEFDKNDEIRKMHEFASGGKEVLEKELRSIANDIVDAKHNINVIKADIAENQELFDKKQNLLDALKVQYELEVKKEFNANETVCPCCGQAYPSNKIEEIKSKFEADKKAKIQEIIDDGNRIKSQKLSIGETLGNLKQTLETANKVLEDNFAKEKDLADKYENFSPKEVSETEEYKRILVEIAEIQKQIDAFPSDIDERLSDLNSRKTEFKNQLSEINSQLAVANNNDLIDSKIADYQEKRLDFEQEKANSEKILYQVDLISKFKNEALVDEINSHFKMVKWSLFEYRKNGSYQECCIPMVGDKELGRSMNSALELQVKLDICSGLQKFNECVLPIFVDQSEIADSKTIEAITSEVDSQLILLKVTDDDLSIY